MLLLPRKYYNTLKPGFQKIQPVSCSKKQDLRNINGLASSAKGPGKKKNDQGWFFSFVTAIGSN